MGNHPANPDADLEQNPSDAPLGANEAAATYPRDSGRGDQEGTTMRTKISGVLRSNSTEQGSEGKGQVATCRVCKETKSLSLFARDKAYRGGVSNRCRKCKADSDRKSYRNRTAKYRAHRVARSRDKKARAMDSRKSREWKDNNAAKLMIYSARKSAAKRGLAFSLTAADITIPACCPLLDIPLVRGADSNRDSSPSLDRIDSPKGYTADNVWVISYRANRIKNNATTEELILIARRLGEYETGERTRVVQNLHPTYEKAGGGRGQPICESGD